MSTKKKGRQIRETEAAASGPAEFHLSGRAATLALWIAAGIFFYAATPAVPERIGDGKEYLCMAHNWMAQRVPWLTEPSIKACLAEMSEDLGLWAPGYVAHGGGQYDAVHFWLLSLLAAPFMGLARSIGLAMQTGFVLLHFALSLPVLWRLQKALGLGRSVACVALLAASPLIFYVDKAHAEFFLAAGILLALAAASERRLLESAFWLALISNQQATMLPLAIVCVAAWAFFYRPRPFAARHLLWPVLALAAALPAPVYTYSRYGTVSIIKAMGQVKPELVSPHRVASLFVDPDLGLFANWPLGLMLLLGAAGLAVALRRKLSDLKGLAILSGVMFAALPVMVSAQANWNNGGTIHISRYALFLIPPICLGFTLLAFRFREELAPAYRTAAGWAVIAVLGLALLRYGGWNWDRYRPAQPERYLEHTELAQWLYTNKPHWYDPVPEIFVERTLGSEHSAFTYTDKTWAVCAPMCNKMYLIRGREDLAKMNEFDPPLGIIGPFSSREEVAAIVSGERPVTGRGYVNRAP